MSIHYFLFALIIHNCKHIEKSEKFATDTHYKVGKKVRQTIKELGGTMPEDLPTPNKSLKELDKYNDELIEK